MKIAVTGHEGNIGSELVKRGYSPLVCDITNLDEVREAMDRVKPDVLIHCAAITNVGECEEAPEIAYRVNVGGVHNLLYDFSGTFIYLSSVHIFNGQKHWDYSEKHRPDPTNIYGFTKWAGEEVSKFCAGRTIVIRLSKLFNEKEITKELDGDFEFTTLIRRSFHYIPHFADNMEWLIDRLDEFPDLDVLNIAGTDTLSYYDFWLQVCNILGMDVNKCTPRTHKIKDYPRPFRGGLRTSKAKKMGMQMYSAADGLKELKENM